jgi:hypothetical protein
MKQNLKDKTLFFPNLGVGGTTAVVRRDLDKVLVGVNYRFGGIGGPRRHRRIGDMCSYLDQAARQPPAENVNAKEAPLL